MARQMKDSGVEWIGEIPKNWKVCRLKDYFLVKNGATPNSGNNAYWNGDILWITPSDYKTNDVYIRKSSRTITREGYDSCGTNIVPINSIIVSNRAPIGSVGIAKVPLCTSQGCKSLVKRNKINSKFVYYYISISNSELNVLGRGTTFLELSSYDLGMFNIPLLSSNEQQKIVDFLDEKVGEIDSVIAKTKETIEDYKKYKQAIITDAVTKGLNPNVEMKESGIEWIGSIPEKWGCMKLRYVVKKIGDIDHYMPEIQPQGIPYIMTGDLKDLTSKINFEKCKKVSYKDFQELSNKIQASYDDVILARYATIGTVSYVDINKDFLVSYSCVTIKPTNFLKGKYLFYYTKTSSFIEELKKYTNANTQGNVGIDSLYQAIITLPSIEEQREIAEYLDEKCSEIDKLIAKKEELLEDLESYKKSLIYEYVTGKKEIY